MTATLPETTGTLQSLASARQHYIESPEDAGGFDSETIIADLEVGIAKAMKTGLAMAAELMAEMNVQGSTLGSETATAIGNFHILRRNALASLLAKPPNPEETAEEPESKAAEETPKG